MAPTLNKEITEITLRDALPKVFAREDVKGSQVWLSDLRFERGGRYLIEAESGAGKSSLCAYIYGNRTDYSGEIFFDKENIRNFSVERWQHLRRSSLAYLPQELSLFPELTALQNIQLKNRLTGHVSDRQIDEWFERLGIAFRRDTSVGRMSIGQQQRVAIIRSLCQPFDFIFLDEPVSHLDETNNHLAAAIITEEAERQGAAVISTSVGNPLALEGAVRMAL